MRIETQKWHNDVISAYKSLMFETLIHSSNIASKKCQIFNFEDESGNQLEPLRGYLAAKEIDEKICTYFIEEHIFAGMPIRINNYEELYLKENSTKKLVIFRPINPSPFKIRSEKGFATDKEMIDSFADFKNSNPDMWTLAKMIAIMGYVGKTFTGLCSPSEFGKSSLFRLIHGLTGKSVVYKPRTPAGALLQLNEDGNVIFEETQKAEPKTIAIIEDLAQMIGDGSPEYINGAVKARYLKQKYNSTNQSLTFLYNIITNYPDPKSFFENIWENPVGLDTKFLKLKLEGEMFEKFDKDFDIRSCAEENKILYMKYAKHWLWLKEIKAKNAYIRRYNYSSSIKFNNRRESIYNEITWMIDRYCVSNEEYQNFINLLDYCILEYKKMTGGSLKIYTNKLIEEPIEMQKVLEREK